MGLSNALRGIQFYVYDTLYLFYIGRVHDFSRKKRLLSYCTGLYVQSTPGIIALKKVTRLDMEDVKTILAWYYMRSAFLDFGKRFTLRVQLNDPAALSRTHNCNYTDELWAD